MIREYITDLLYPRRCMVCHRPAPFGEYMCPACGKRLPVIESRRCAKCGKPVEDYEEVCPDCMKTRHVYDAGIGIYRYDTVMREAMGYLKYRGRREYGETMGIYAARAARSELDLWRPQVIVAVPVDPDRKAQRGYNQAEVIAEAVSAESRIPLVRNGLFRKDGTAAMKNLTARERYVNLARAFEAGEEIRGFHSVLIVDDIYTTGATVDAAARALRAAGIPRICFLAVCIGSGFMVSY